MSGIAMLQVRLVVHDTVRSLAEASTSAGEVATLACQNPEPTCQDVQAT